MDRGERDPQAPHQTTAPELQPSRTRARVGLDPKAHALLLEAALTFRGYEKHHRDKAWGLHSGGPDWRDATDKAEVNAGIAGRIERYLDGQRRESLNLTEPGVAPTDANSADLQDAYFGTAYQSAVEASNGVATQEEASMRTILKYRIDVRNPALTLPANAVVRHVAHETGMAAHIVSLWVDCPDVPTLDAAPHPEGCRFKSDWEVLVFGTGQAINVDPGVGYLGSAIAFDQMQNQLVWHVYGRERL